MVIDAVVVATQTLEDTAACCMVNTQELRLCPSTKHREGSGMVEG